MPIGYQSQVDLEIMPLAVQLIEATELENKEAQKRYDFWRNLNPSKIKQQSFSDREHQQSFLIISPKGAQEGYYNTNSS